MTGFRPITDRINKLPLEEGLILEHSVGELVTDST